MPRLTIHLPLQPLLTRNQAEADLRMRPPGNPDKAGTGMPVFDLATPLPAKDPEVALAKAMGLDTPLSTGMVANAHGQHDLRTGIPPVFTAAARQRWAAQRRERGIQALERLFS